eukprot:jgi/Botrbrau1/3632/Bobra.0204s0023.1
MQLMPFQSSNLEQAFLQHFHSSRALYDVAMGICGLGVLAFYRDFWPDSRVVCLVGLTVLTSVIAFAFMQGYAKYRPYIVHFTRLYISFASHLALIRCVAHKPTRTFMNAAVNVFYTSNRARDLLLVCLLFPLPLRGSAFMAHTFTAAFLLAHLKEDCAKLGGLPAYERFAAEWAGLHAAWQGEGTGAMCQEFSLLLLDEAVPLRWLYRLGCPVVLPVLLTVYGGRWSQMCLIHRLLWLPLGYVFPLVVLYVWEMRDRWEFARKKGFRVPEITACLLGGIRPVLKEAFFNLATACVVFTSTF